MPEQHSLQEHYQYFDKLFQRAQRHAERAQRKANQAKKARDGIRAAMELNGEWVGNDTAGAAKTATGLTGSIRQALAELGPETEVTVASVKELMQEQDPDMELAGRDATISSALRRLAADSFLELVTRGAGKRASTYRLAATDGGKLTDHQPVTEGSHAENT